MKKAFISLVFIIGFGAYAFYNYANANNSTDSAVVTTTTDTTQAQPVPSNTSGNSAPPTSTKTAMATTPTAPIKKTHTGQYTDGTYIGDAADAYYGMVQVKATISGGKLTNVTFLQYPNDRGESISINRQAMPMLRQEAIQAQSANIDGVSGASDSSAAFQQSLASALAQAKA